MSLIIGLITLISLAFTVRVLILRNSIGWFSRGFAGDSSVHVQIIKKLRNGQKQKGIKNYVIPNRMSYPVLFHRFCAFFSEKTLEKHSYLPNLLVFIFSYAIFAFYALISFKKYFPDINFHILFTGLACHIITIQNLVIAGPAIAYVKLSARFLAKVSVSFFFLSLFFYLEFSDEVSFWIAISSATFGFLSGTFAAQALLFFPIAYGIITFDPSALYVISCGFLASLFVSLGYSMRSVLEMIRYWRIYFLRVKKSRYTAPVLSSFLNPLETIKNLLWARLKLLGKQLYKREPSRLILFYPDLVVILLLMFLKDSNLQTIKFIYISITAIYLLTSLSSLNFLGESYRYLEYGLFFLNPLILTLLIFTNYGSHFTIYFFITYALYNILISLMINRLYGHKHESGKDNLRDFLLAIKLTKEDVVFPVSMRLGADIVARTGCRSFWWQPGGITDLKMYDDYIHEYPYLSLDWRKLAERHDVSMIIVDKQAEKKFLDSYNFDGLQIKHEDQHYLAYSYN